MKYYTAGGDDTMRMKLLTYSIICFIAFIVLILLHQFKTRGLHTDKSIILYIWIIVALLMSIFLFVKAILLKKVPFELYAKKTISDFIKTMLDRDLSFWTYRRNISSKGHVDKSEQSKIAYSAVLYTKKPDANAVRINNANILEFIFNLKAQEVADITINDDLSVSFGEFYEGIILYYTENSER